MGPASYRRTPAASRRRSEPGVAYYDLFHVQDGKIVEHWDVISPIPAELPHTNEALPS